MSATSARLLRLLSLLQTPREWSGSELAERLEVSRRTVRRDVDRLRGLGYPVHATRGGAGGYRLAAGAKLPPLLLDDEEAVAVAVSLRSAALGTVAGLQDTARRALSKLEQVLPPRLRGPVRAIEAATVTIPDRDTPTVTPAALAALATACRDRQSLRFDYTAHDGTGSYRRTEPLRLVSWGERWYLVAFDLDRDDWRTFRVDRIEPRGPTGPPFAAREAPAGDLTASLTRQFGAMWPVRAVFRVHAPAERIAPGIAPADGVVEAVDDATCLVTLGGSDPLVVTSFLCMFGVDFTLVEGEEAAAALRDLRDRCDRALMDGPTGDPAGGGPNAPITP
ncbi:WYL domain-containing protein [Glycomyces sp. TRM65418]|uniref:helix-turn-helix transcriptional regulator n=1 Tax=Glycomyces sp. TRM65418 TaxID=2867006 RepID=UPI001CE6D279|nr:WYL domain-containing protein [Glycomyces sp. TRM65418]MCC3761846.1 WYL domain-containing protein [Glycomyces sp. TRM65418]QZD55928.1 WYL domain-containing protein [Glycomyces sp. TRM65418]